MIRPGRRSSGPGDPDAPAVRGRLVACLEHAAATNTSALFGIYRWGWGFSTSQDFNGDIALSRASPPPGPGHDPPVDADPFGFLCPWNEVPRSWGLPHPPVLRDRHGRGHLPDGVACRNRPTSRDVHGRMVVGIEFPMSQAAVQRPPRGSMRAWCPAESRRRSRDLSSFCHPTLREQALPGVR